MAAKWQVLIVVIVMLWVSIGFNVLQVRVKDLKTWAGKASELMGDITELQMKYAMDIDQLKAQVTTLNERCGLGNGKEAMYRSDTQAQYRSH